MISTIVPFRSVMIMVRSTCTIETFALFLPMPSCFICMSYFRRADVRSCWVGVRMCVACWVQHYVSKASNQIYPRYIVQKCRNLYLRGSLKRSRTFAIAKLFVCYNYAVRCITDMSCYIRIIFKDQYRGHLVHGPMNPAAMLALGNNILNSSA